MPKIEYRTIDKSSWGLGPWQDEPDKVQWTDPETGLPCLIKRVEHSGHLCGYVGVGPDHPLHGRTGYDKEGLLSVHGGITFNDSCQDMSIEAWKKARVTFDQCEAEAQKYPIGDAANLRKKWRSVIDHYDAWKEKAKSEFICHVPEPGTPDDIWWFGFDCAHSGDSQPARRSFGFSFGGRDDEYRTLAYVEANIRDLAKQLAALKETV